MQNHPFGPDHIKFGILHMILQRLFITLFSAGCLIIPISCKQVYEPPAVKNNPRFLVVDGFLTSAPDSTYITLTRTRNLSDSAAGPPETSASVVVESQTGSAVPLAETAGGMYGGLLSLDSSRKYRLVIQTADGKQYASDFIPFKITPLIDSIGFKEDSANVALVVSTHDPINNTRYYRWAYEETWKYNTYFLSEFNLVEDSVVIRRRDGLIYFCWASQRSSDIQLGSSAGLSQDIISQIIFHNVAKKSEKIYVQYSILAKQYALTRDQFDYWTNLKKTTEQLGTVFDAQPSQVTGNIHCVSDSSEIVLGCLCASTIARKKIFLTRNQLTNYNYTPYYVDCATSKDAMVVIDPGDKTKVYEYLVKPDHLYTFLYQNGGYFVAQNFCADCREHGGTNVKPDFWPYP